MTRSNRPLGFATRAIHHGYDPLAHEGALTPPVHMTSTFAFETAGAGGEMFAGERAGHVYSRISNPTNAVFEERMSALEGAVGAHRSKITGDGCLKLVHRNGRFANVA